MQDRPTLAHALEASFDRATHRGEVAFNPLIGAEPVDERDALEVLLALHDLHLAPIEGLGGRERWQHHPVVSQLKRRLESDLAARLDRLAARRPPSRGRGVVATVRSIAAADRVPAVYRWLATDATLEEARAFLALEGGPDGGFDDLVAVCQLGLDGEPKVEMARNYWDEMGNGSSARVHTELHRKLTRALDLPGVPTADQPIEGLRRNALGGMLATNRHLQPEMVGALGLIEMQAGPRCRQVVAALERLGAGEEAADFYVEHAEADPRHGKAWLDNVIAPLADRPRFAAGIVRGARWRSVANAGFLAALADRFAPGLLSAGLAS